MVFISEFLVIEILSAWLKGSMCQAQGGEAACEWHGPSKTLYPPNRSINYQSASVQNAETDEKGGNRLLMYFISGCSLAAPTKVSWIVQHNDWWLQLLQAEEDERTMWRNEFLCELTCWICLRFWHWLLQRIQPRLKPRFNLSWLVAYAEGAFPAVGLDPCCICGPQKKEIDTALWKLLANQLEDPIKLVAVNRHASAIFEWLDCVIYNSGFSSTSPP